MVSLSRGNHWIIEDCVMRHANAVALDIGMQGGGKVSPAVIGYAIVRRNHIDDVGVCGLAGLAVQNTLIESNLIEHVGWQDAELTWEAGAIKLHVSRNCLLQHNVIRHLDHAMAIWLDYMNNNTRVTGNVIGDTLETVRGGIYIEASHNSNMFDHNIIWKATPGHGGSTANFPSHGGWGITLDGTDETVIAHNITSPYRQIVLEAFQKHQVPLHMDIEMPTVETIKKMVQSKMGVAFVPRMCAQAELANGELVEIPVRELQVARKIRLVHPAHRNLSHATTAFLELVKGSHS